LPADSGERDTPPEPAGLFLTGLQTPALLGAFEAADPTFDSTAYFFGIFQTLPPTLFSRP